MTSDELRSRVQAAAQRRTLQQALTTFDATDLLPGDQTLIAGQAADEFRSLAMAFCAPSIRKGRTMPNGYTLTVCYGEDSLLPRVPVWVKKTQPNATYVVGMDWLGTGVERGFTSTALIKVQGHVVKDLVGRLLARDPVQWPWQFFWIEEELTTGVVFDEYAGTPRDPPGADDKRIFEVACW